MGGDGLSKKDTQNGETVVDCDESVSTRDETRRFLSLHFRAFSTVVCTFLLLLTHMGREDQSLLLPLVCIQAEVA